MARAKAQEVKKNGGPLVDRMLDDPDLVGKLGSWTAPMANWANESKIHRKFMEGALGIHKDKTLAALSLENLCFPFSLFLEKSHRRADGEDRFFLDLFCQLQCAGHRHGYAGSYGAEQC